MMRVRGAIVTASALPRPPERGGVGSGRGAGMGRRATGRARAAAGSTDGVCLAPPAPESADRQAPPYVEELAE
jgi:hypothetical protein